jgi:hypothetical protein
MISVLAQGPGDPADFGRYFVNVRLRAGARPDFL